MTMRLLRYMMVRRVFYLYFFIIVVLLFMYLNKSSVADILDRKTMLLKIDEAIKNYGNTGACKQPNLPVYSPEIMKFIKTVPPIDCSKAGPDWVKCENSECRILEDIKIQKGMITCAFTDILRKNDYGYEDGETTTSDSYYKLEKSDTVRISCKSSEERWETIKSDIRFEKKIWDRAGWEHVPKDGLKMNVLMLAFDSLSRNSVIRKMPETYKFLTETLHAHVLQSHNIIGDGTPQALTPMLTGKTELELPETRKRVRDSSYVDVYPFIWNDFRNNGYVTGYLEDCQSIGTYTYRLRGFNKPPTDHYMRPYYLASQKWHGKWPNLCAGAVPRHMVMMNYLKSFFNVYKDKPKFMFAFHAELSHDDYNLIGAADSDIANFLKELHGSGALNNTLLIVFADHGHRFAEIRNTMQGKLEERLPFFSFTFPPWFRHKHLIVYENLKHNVKSLTTPFDIYSTLKSVLHIGNTGNANLTERSLSLFSKISHERSCTQAYIEPHWCACLEWNSISLSEPIVQQIADAFVKALNDFTDSQRDKCAVLKVAAIYWVSKLTPNENLLKYKKNYDYDGFVPDLSGKTDISDDIYQINLMLTPGDSLFEATILHHLKESRFEVKLKDVSRINMYGRQPHCIENEFPHLRKYCYCNAD